MLIARLTGSEKGQGPNLAGCHVKFYAKQDDYEYLVVPSVYLGL